MYRLAVLLALVGLGECWDWWGYDHHHNHDHGHFFDQSGGSEDCDSDGDDDWGWRGHRHGHRGRKHPYRWHLDLDRRFSRLSSSIIEAEQMSQAFCKVCTSCKVQELNAKSGYTLIYTLPRCDPDNIVVKIRHRVLYMYTKEGAEKAYDMRVLPALLKLSEAEWSCNDAQLTIAIPYDVDLMANAQRPCPEINITTDEITVSNVLPLGFRYG